jgi:hypothetical protein
MAVLDVLDAVTWVGCTRGRKARTEKALVRTLYLVKIQFTHPNFQG